MDRMRQFAGVVERPARGASARTAAAGADSGSGRTYAAEFLGTALLVFAAVGSAVFARNSGGVIVVGLCFGLVMFALHYALSPVSGAHLNPAVTLGVLLSRKMNLATAVGYWVAQVLGAIVAAFVLYGLKHWGRVIDETGNLGSNSYGLHINAGGAVVVEFILTFLFVLVVLLVSGRARQRGPRGAAIGLALGLCNLVAIPLTGASINPARSIGPALWNGGSPLRQLWLFIVIPLLGGAAAALVAPLFSHGHADEDGEDDRGDAAGGRGAPSRGAASRGAASRWAERDVDQAAVADRAGRASAPDAGAAPDAGTAPAGGPVPGGGAKAAAATARSAAAKAKRR